MDPCRDAWGTAFQLVQDEIQPCGENLDAVYTRDTYDLNDPRKVTIRRFRRETLEERIAVITQGRALHDRLLQRARETSDPTFVDDAERVWRVYELSLKDLERFDALPPDFDPDCRCGIDLLLPAVLEEQLL